MKPESERGLYSRSLREVHDAETNAARPLIVMEVELVMWSSCREVAVREIVIMSSSVTGERFESSNIYDLVIRERSGDGRTLLSV